MIGTDPLPKCADALKKLTQADCDAACKKGDPSGGATCMPGLYNSDGKTVAATCLVIKKTKQGTPYPYSPIDEFKGEIKCTPPNTGPGAMFDNCKLYKCPGLVDIPGTACQAVFPASCTNPFAPAKK